MSKKYGRYLHLGHEEAHTIIGGRWVAAFTGLAIVAVFALGLGVGHRIGHRQGRANMNDEVRAVIDESIRSGGWFAFEGGQVKLIAVVRTDSGKFRRATRARAERYDLVRYRAVQAFGPEDDDKGVEF